MVAGPDTKDLEKHHGFPDGTYIKVTEIDLSTGKPPAENAIVMEGIIVPPSQRTTFTSTYGPQTVWTIKVKVGQIGSDSGLVQKLREEKPNVGDTFQINGSTYRLEECILSESQLIEAEP